MPDDPRGCAIEHTLEFLTRALTVGVRTVLEVGAGDGLLAAALEARGIQVLALDEDPAAVATARARGVVAHEARFPEFHGGPFDAVLFTRSLHHIGPLEPAVDGARELLVSDGTLMIEDFAWERQTPAGAAWLDRALAPFASPEDDHASADPMARWRDHHVGHAVHTGALLLGAVSRSFTLAWMETAPYLYRYACARAPRDPEGVAAARRVFEEERREILAGTLPALGLRMVAVPRRTVG